MLLAPFAALAISLSVRSSGLGLSVPAGPRRAHVSYCSLSTPEEPPDTPDGVEDGMECETTGRIVTEFKATGGADPIPDRFMTKIQAIRGDFSPDEPALDTEQAEDSLLSAFVKFPAVVKVRVVSRVIDPDQVQDFVADMTALCSTAAADDVVGVGKVTPRGTR